LGGPRTAGLSLWVFDHLSKNNEIYQPYKGTINQCLIYRNSVYYFFCTQQLGAPMPQRHHERQKETAEYYYIVDKMTLTAISDLMDIKLETLKYWRKTREWEEKRKRSSLNPHILAHRTMGVIDDMLHKIADEKRIPTTGESDSMNKLYKMVEGLSNSARFVANGTEIMRMLIEYLEINNPDIVAEMKAVAADFVHKLYERYKSDAIQL
jgi:hypothetical protein